MDTLVTPWNKDQAIGQKAPLRHYQVWRIRRALEKREEWRNLALFSTAVDSMLRSPDLLALKVGYEANPARFKGKQPRPDRPPEAVWINSSADDSADEQEAV